MLVLKALNTRRISGLRSLLQPQAKHQLRCREFDAKLRTRSTCSQEMNPKSKRSILLLCLQESLALSNGTRS